jgi:hypothetical protein
MLVLTVFVSDVEIVSIHHRADQYPAYAPVQLDRHLPKNGHDSARKNGRASISAAATTMAVVVRRMKVRVKTTAS